MPLPAAKKMSVCPFTSPSEGDRKSTRLNSSHSQISYAVFFFKKNTRLNSSHSQISYAVFCLKKKTHPPSTRRVRVPLLSLHSRTDTPLLIDSHRRRLRNLHLS